MVKPPHIVYKVSSGGRESLGNPTVLGDHFSGAVQTGEVSPSKSSKKLQRAITKDALHRKAKELLPFESRLQSCLCARKDKNQFAGLDYDLEKERIIHTNLIRCDNPWICPNCGRLRAAEEAQKLRWDVGSWVLEGKAVVAFADTLQHFSCEGLGVVLARLAGQSHYELVKVGEGEESCTDEGWLFCEVKPKRTGKRDKGAMSLVFQSRQGRKFKKKWRIVMVRRSIDDTVGENGWHPHVHGYYFLDRPPLTEAEQREFWAEYAGLWQAACKSVGGYADLDHGTFCAFPDEDGQGVFDMVDYIAGKACGGAGAWGGAEETTRHHDKRAKEGHRNANQLLFAAVNGDKEAGRLWAEHALELKGRQFLSTDSLDWENYRSPRKILNELHEKHADELEAMFGKPTEPTDPEMVENVCLFGPEAKRQVYGFNGFKFQLTFIGNRAKGDAVVIREWLEARGVTQVYYPTIDKELPDWMYMIPEDGGVMPSPDVIAARRALGVSFAVWNTS